jgi:hypothetical protein
MCDGSCSDYLLAEELNERHETFDFSVKYDFHREFQEYLLEHSCDVDLTGEYWNIAKRYLHEAINGGVEWSNKEVGYVVLESARLIYKFHNDDLDGSVGFLANTAREKGYR